jgi:hypothetical protein
MVVKATQHWFWKKKAVLNNVTVMRKVAQKTKAISTVIRKGIQLLRNKDKSKIMILKPLSFCVLKVLGKVTIYNKKMRPRQEFSFFL